MRAIGRLWLVEFLIASVFLVGTFLSFWAISLIVRALAERAEIRAIRRREIAGDTSRPLGAATPRPGTTQTGTPVNPLRNVLVFTLAPLAFAAGLAVCWVSLGGGRLGDSLPWVDRLGALVVMTLIAQIQVSAALICVGWWFDPSRGRRRCPTCWYDMAGTAGLLCPECGREARSERRLFRTRRKRGLIELGVLVAALCYITLKIPQGRASGAFALVPTTLLIATYEYWPEPLISRSVPGASSASLFNRVAERDVFDWQQSWLMWRVERKLKAATDPREIIPMLEQLGGLARGVDFDPMKGNPELIRRTFNMLGSEDGKERLAAAGLFGGPMIPERDAAWIAVAKECALAAAGGLADSNPSVLMSAAEVVSYAGAAADPYMQGIFQAIESDRSGQRRRAWQNLYVLAVLSRTRDDALEKFVAYSRSGDSQLRMAAARLVNVACRCRPEAIDALKSMLNDPSDAIAARAASSLRLHMPREELAKELFAQIARRARERETMLEIIRDSIPVRGEFREFPGWIIQELIAIVTDSGRPASLRMAAVGVLSDLPPEQMSMIVPAIQSLSREQVLEPADQRELEAMLSRMDLAPQEAQPELSR